MPAITLAPDIVDLVDKLMERVATLEQRLTSPEYAIPNGSTPTFPGINLGEWGGSTTPIDDGASSPTNLVLTPGVVFDEVYVDASWTAPADGSAAHYEVQIARKNTTTGVYTLVDSRNTIGTNTRISGLEPNATYGIKVYAMNRLGFQSVPLPAASYQDFVTGQDSTIPGQVTGVVATAGTTSIMLTWNESADEDVRLGAGTYEVQRSTAQPFTGSEPIIRTSGTLASFAGLASGVPVYFRVRSVDASSNPGPWSATVSATPGSPGTPSDGIAPTASPAPTVIGGPGFLFARWVAATNADPLSYDIHLSTVSGFATSAATLVGNVEGTQVFIKTLPNGSALAYDTTYYIKLVSRDRDGVAASGAQGSAQMVRVTTPDLAVGSITAASGIIASLDAGIISTGTLNAARIGAGTIDVSRLSVGATSDNMVPNGDCEDLAPDGSLANWIKSGLATLGTETSSTIAGARSGTLSAGGSAVLSTQVESAAFPVSPSTKYYFASIAKWISGTSGATYELMVQWLGSSGGSLLIETIASSGAVNGNHNLLQGQTTSHASAKMAKVLLRFNNIPANSVYAFDSVRANPAVGNVRIENGAVTADKILAASIVTSHISATGLDAATIKFGTMSGDRITANTLDIGSIKTGTLTARTITLGVGGQIVAGPNPLGGASATGMLMNDGGLGGYKAGVRKFFIDANTGDAYFSGDLTGASGTFSGSLSGATITGGTITGGVFQTSSSTNVERIVIDSVSAKNTIKFMPGVVLSGQAQAASIAVYTNSETQYGQDLVLDSGRGSATTFAGGDPSILILRPGYGGNAGFDLRAYGSYGEIGAAGELRLFGGEDIASQAQGYITLTSDYGVVIEGKGLYGNFQEGISRGVLKNFERGRTSVTFAGTASKDTSLTYSVFFDATPTIQTTCSESGAALGNFYTQVFNQTASGCTVRIRDADGTARTGTTAFEHWACL